jgi:CRP-like cAMP-binding protein
VTDREIYPLTNFRVLFESYAGSDLPGWDEVARTERTADLARGETLLTPGQCDRVLYLVQKGVLAVQALTPRGGVETLALREEGEIVTAAETLNPEALARVTSKQFNPQMTSLATLETGQSTVRISALEPSRVIGYDFSVIARLLDTHQAWALAFNTCRHVTLLSEQLETHRRRTLSTEELYQLLEDERPGLVARLRQKDIAAYLGVSEASLSRLIKRRRESAKDLISQ